MDTKTIALDRDAYDLLRRRRRKGESFSDAVKRLAREARPVSEFAAAWKKHLSDSEIEEIGKAIARGRETDRDRARRLAPRQG